MTKKAPETNPDVVLVGAGIMSATLGALLKELQPDLTIEIFESLDAVAAESSDAWNNAGTGHSALCELNYTPEMPDGSIDISKALKINESFKVSKQFWSHLVQNHHIKSPKTFINRIAHLSFVMGEKDSAYLRKRFEALQPHHLFKEMVFSDDHAQLAKWMPLIMEGRDPKQAVAATRMSIGTDVNFGSLTRSLISYLKDAGGVNLNLHHEVVSLKRAPHSTWKIEVLDKSTGEKRIVTTKFVFLGAGGGALPLLQKSGIKEGRGYGGFPVSGQRLRCTNDELIAQHNAKVYGKASVGAPPMSVPHLDTRMIDGKKGLLFGPYAGFTTKYLKKGSFFDLPLSLKPDNLIPMMAAGLHNIDLTKYLIGQVLQSPVDRFSALHEFMPTAKIEDWKLEVAGQRVQVIKADKKKGGILQFGTEVICASDGSISALLGASPGASTAVSIMLELVQNCFRDKVASPEWQKKLKEMIPSYGESLIKDPHLYDRVRSWTRETLGLQEELHT